MIAFFANIVAAFVIAPPLLWALLFLLLLVNTERPVALRKASDWTTPFFSISIVFMANELWPSHGVWVVSVGLIIVMCSFWGFIHWVNPKAPIWTKGKALWRLCFLTSTASYMFFLILAIVSRGLLL
ncbi:DUF3397 family protein [Bacillus sp. JCM 19041]|uniref:DUF3397 family protein n=1 Tax=Bacillus sp. JCM 19041 TaxID=1460637 RepID=UPI0009E7E49C